MKLLRTLCPAILLAGCAALLAAAPAQAQQGITDETILLGHSGALSGPLAELSREYLSGATLYFDDLNGRGGVNNRRIALLSLDDAYDPDKAAANVARLIEQEKVFALFGCFGTGPSVRAVPLASRARVPFFAPYTGADALREPADPYVFHLRASYAQEIDAMVSHLVTLGVRAIGVVHHADPFGQAGLVAAEQALRRHQLLPAVVAPIASSGADAPNAARRVVAANPAALILVTAGDSSAAFLRALRLTDARPMLYGLSVISSRQLIRELGADAHGLVIAQVVPSPFRLDHSVVREYRKLADQAGQPYSYTALEGFLAAKTFAEGLRRAGRELNREKLIGALQGMGNWDAGGLRMQFSARRQVGLDYVDLSVISRGNFTR
ncbi:ABC transporter permease [Pseudothauera nasutitermitis]|uniref:ABC transporter permease n=1 Tax=Pseudothauera nasutitermitis TaxID=2565930 RepID=A0A4V3WCE7_9RHOO|nr:ABC transporter substrate-binding protein [Pseudothauera nasutitermitis]THF66874.1 ABC transporter permease [Pseudothauera nasutitermitis]